jgi:hypothetical protein
MASQKEGRWPGVEEQLREGDVATGSPLEQLIRDNQDFDLLDPREADDDVGIPPWLRVYWRKRHPDENYSKVDPYGAYPEALHHIHEWMLSHPDLPSGGPAESAEPGSEGEGR